MAQAQRRATAIRSQVDLAGLGVHPVELVDGVTMWSSGSGSLHPDPEAALAELGLGVVITLEGRVFVEPWGGGGPS